MVPLRRSQPFWRSIIAPASLGLLWPSVLCGFWFFFISEFGNPLSAEAVGLGQQEIPSTPTFVTNPKISPTEGNSHAFLEIGGKVVVDQELTHLGILQMQPEGSLLAFDLIPTGSETSSLGQVQLYHTETGEVVASFGGHGPSWTPQGKLSFRNAQGQAVSYDLETSEFTVIGEIAAASSVESQAIPDPNQLTPFRPTTIRVRHRDLNHCRGDTPVDQIDVIPIEEYVARVLPAEVPPSWDMEALKAQAIAARTYAINHIYHNQNDRYPYDVSDWANKQMMCDYRNARTDQAAAETAGMILSPIVQADLLPINAMYSAESGHPTRKHGYLEYLDSVPDVNAIGLERRGHGWGLSQLGAQRLAKQGLNFCQILGHYYQQVHLNNLSVPEQPIGCLRINDQSGFATGAGLHIRAISATLQEDLTVTINKITVESKLPWATLAPEVEVQLTLPDLESVQPAIDFDEAIHVASEVTEEDPPTDAVPETGTTANEDPENTLPVGEELIEEEETTELLPVQIAPAWPVSLPISDGELLWYFPSDVETGTVLEIELKSGETSLHTVSIEVDYVGPQHLEFGLLESNVPDVPQLSASAAPGDSVSVGRDWRWEQSALFYSEDSGELVQDLNASDGILWLGVPERHQPGAWYGPYTSVLPGGQSYRALFKIGIGAGLLMEDGAVDAVLPVARLDVAIEKGVTVLGLRDLYLTDFKSEVDLYSFPVDFHLFESAEDLEFRVVWFGNYPVAFDNVSVVGLPFSDWENHPLPLPLVPDSPVRDLRIVAFDEASNISTLFSLHLGSQIKSQQSVPDFDECSWLGDCRAAASAYNLPTAIE